jgi:hypothetical protein
LPEDALQVAVLALGGGGLAGGGIEADEHPMGVFAEGIGADGTERVGERAVGLSGLRETVRQPASCIHRQEGLPTRERLAGRCEPLVDAVPIHRDRSFRSGDAPSPRLRCNPRVGSCRGGGFPPRR